MQNIKEIEAINQKVTKLAQDADSVISGFFKSNPNGVFGLTEFIKDLVSLHNCTFGFAHAIVSLYIAERNDLKVQMGKGGGLMTVAGYEKRIAERKADIEQNKARRQAKKLSNKLESPAAPIQEANIVAA